MKFKKVLLSLFGIGLLFIVFSNVVLSAKSENKGQDKKETSTEQGNSQKRGGVTLGNVQSVSEDTLVIEEKKGKRKQETQVDTTTKVVGQDKKILRLRNLKLNDEVGIISTDSSSPGMGKKAIKVFVKNASSSAQIKRRAVHGIVTGISGNVITLVHQIHQERIYSVSVGPLTLITMKGNKNASLSDIQINQRITAVGDPDGNGTILAKRIHIIPGKAIGVFNKSFIPTSTPSATPVSSISATLTPAEPAVSPTEVPSPTISL